MFSNRVPNNFTLNLIVLAAPTKYGVKTVQVSEHAVEGRTFVFTGAHNAMHFRSYDAAKAAYDKGHQEDAPNVVQSIHEQIIASKFYADTLVTLHVFIDASYNACKVTYQLVTPSYRTEYAELGAAIDGYNAL